MYLEKAELENKEIANNLFREMLEKVAFMFAEDIEQGIETPDIQGDLVVSNITFEGDDLEGCTIILPYEMCVELSENMLGMAVDGDMVRTAAMDACGEFLNIVCGNLTTELLGEEVQMHLSPPKTIIKDAQDCSHLFESPLASRLMIDDEHLALILLESTKDQSLNLELVLYSE